MFGSDFANRHTELFSFRFSFYFLETSAPQKTSVWSRDVPGRKTPLLSFPKTQHVSILNISVAIKRFVNALPRLSFKMALSDDLVAVTSQVSFLQQFK